MDLSEALDKERTARELRKLTTPIDFDRLAADGVLERAGSWWRVLDYERLPDYAKAQITEMESGQGGALARFARGQKSAAKSDRQPTGKPVPLPDESED